MKSLSVVFALLLLTTATLSAPRDPKADADAILAAYGSNKGLATIVSNAEEIPAEMVSQLAAHGLAVHVIAGNASARDKLVRNLGSSPASSAIMVEHLPLSSLPYLDHFANLLVADDRSVLKAGRPGQAELERVITPGGMLAVRKGNAWQFTRKAWPGNMDNWTHPNYDATNNKVSRDEVLQTPFGYKWIDGMGVPPPSGSTCRGWIVNGGRLFVQSSAEPENFVRPGSSDVKAAEYLVARDAFNGLVLWKQRLGPPADRSFWSQVKGAALVKVAPIAVDSHAVYAVREGKLTAFDPRTGTVLFTCDNTYVPWAVRVNGGAIVTAGFSAAADSGKGGLEVFDVSNGSKRWTLERTVNSIAASTNTVFAQTWASTPEQSAVFACDLTSGTELFTISGADCKGAVPRILSVGDSYALINKKFAIACVSPRDGKTMWQLDSVPYFWGPVINGELWIDGRAIDVATGRTVRQIPHLLFGEGWGLDDNGDDFGCVAMGMVGNLMLSGRHHRYQRVGADSLELYYYRGMRAGCGPSMAAANGMLFTPQVNCVCNPTHPLGFTAVAHVANDPTPVDFTSSHGVERGPAFDAIRVDAARALAWPLFRANAERSSSSNLAPAYTYSPQWQTPVLAGALTGTLQDSRDSRAMAAVSPPVCGDGRVVVVSVNRGEVLAYDERSGSELWRYRAGSRIETPPSLLGTGCFFGCNDGYVYALDARDGRLAWRTRIAPREDRIMDHGMVESRWPVYGSVLVYRNTIYAAAGKTSEVDGGVVIVAMDPSNGERRWARLIDVTQLAKNDILGVRNGRIVWQNIDLDPASGEGDLLKGREILGDGPDVRSGMWDDTYLTAASSRRVGQIYNVGGHKGWLLAWNDRTIVDQTAAIFERASDTAHSTDKGDGRKRVYFDIARQPTAIVVTPKTIVLGFGDSTHTRGRIEVRSMSGQVLATIALGSGVAANGIAVGDSGIAVTLDNGSLAYLRGGHVEPRNEGIVQRVNCGGAAFTDSKGNAWSADQSYTAGSWGRVGGSGYDRTKDIGRLVEIQYKQVAQAMRRQVAGPDAYLYHTELGGPTAYRFTVPNGRYEIILHFAETYFFNTMMLPNGDLSWMHRRFDVALNGVPVLSNFEPAAVNNGRTHIPVVKRFETEVGDGDLTIGFTSIENSAIINAIEVRALPDAAHSRSGATPAAGTSMASSGN